MEDSKKSLLRDTSLLFIGAFISLLTSLLGTFFKEKSDTQKQKIERKLEFNYELSKALGNRFYFTYNLAQHKGSNDTSVIKEELSGFVQSRQFWNQNVYSYKALLKSYYGADVRVDFENKIYRPLVDMGHYVENTSANKDPDAVSKIDKIGLEISHFMEQIYNQVEK
jgi:hypothetical protein